MSARPFFAVSVMCLAVYAVCLPAWGQASQPAGPSAVGPGPNGTPASAPAIAPGGELAKGLDEVNADQLAELTKLIRTTDSPEAAMAAYAKGCAIDRNSLELQRAYLVRMVQFRKPDVAYYPAKPLVTLDTSNGLAQEVVGYYDATHNDLDAALSDYLKANRLAPKANSVQHNLGLLAAWYDHQKPAPKLADGDKAALTQAKTDLAADPDFSNGLKRGNAAWDALAAAQQKAQKDLIEVEKDLTTAKTQVKNLEQQMVSLNQNINSQQRNLDNLRSNVNAGYSGSDPNYRQNQINQQQQQLNNLRRQHDQLAQKGRDAVAVEQKKQKLVDDVKAKLAAMAKQQPANYQWAPPAAPNMTAAGPPASPPASPVTE